MQATIKATTIQKLQYASKSTKNDKTKQLSEFFFRFVTKMLHNICATLTNVRTEIKYGYATFCVSTNSPRIHRPLSSRQRNTVPRKVSSIAIATHTPCSP